MKQVSLLSLAGLLFAGSVSAATPVDEWYVGLLVGANKASKLTLSPITNPVTGLISATPSLTFSPGIDVAGTVGYRWENFRLEGEILYNNSPLDKLKLDNFVVHKHTTPVPAINGINYLNDGFKINGKNYLFGGLFNALYEFHEEGSQANFVPYVGVGIGFGSVQESLDLYYHLPNASYQQTYTTTNTTNTLLGQAILGISYFMDDCMAIGIDYRYLTGRANLSHRNYNNTNNRHSQQINMLNLTFTYAIDPGN